MRTQVLIAVPKGRAFLDGFVTSLLVHFMAEEEHDDVSFRIAFADSIPLDPKSDDPNIYEAVATLREKLVQEAIDNNYDYIWFLDDDMSFPPNIFRRLYHHQKDFVTAIAHLKNPPYEPNIKKETTHIDPVTKQLTVAYSPITEYPDGGLMPIAACGLACALIKVDAIKQLPKPWFTLPYASKDHPVGEDIAFCRRFMEAGIPIYADCGAKIGHIDSKHGRLITELDFKAQKQGGLA